jgi:filamentous hemagglutinin family protein
MQLTSARRPLRRQQSARHIGLAIALLLADAAVAQSAFAAGALPQGGNYVAGAGTIANGHNGLVITQPGSTRGVIDWNSFSIGKNNSVTFNNGSGATLNRVTGGSMSAILGSLSATGSLYLINPQGIVVGPSGVVSTGGRFVASTLGVCNCAFMRGAALKLSGDTNASVINLGKISSSGGDVFLIARQFVVNAGSIKAPKGTAEMAVGSSVLLQDSASSKQVFVQTGSQGMVVNKGKIDAAQISLQAAFVNADPAVIDAPSKGYCSERPTLGFAEDAAGCAAVSRLVGAKSLRGLEVGSVFERKPIDFELPSADRSYQSVVIGHRRDQPHGFAHGRH